MAGVVSHEGRRVIVQQSAERFDLGVPESYSEWLVEVKQRVRATQFRAARAANVEVLRLYWSIGHDIAERQAVLRWGAKVLQRVSQDLIREFPGQQGWSPTNLKYMRLFSQAWPDLEAIGPQAVDQLPWGHIRVLIDRLNIPGSNHRSVIVHWEERSRRPICPGRVGSPNRCGRLSGVTTRRTGGLAERGRTPEPVCDATMTVM